MKWYRSIVVRLAILAILVVVGLVLALRTMPRIQRYRATEEICAAANRGDFQAALDASPDLIGDDPAGRRAGQCRCQALLALGRRAECVDLLEGLLASDPAAGTEEAWLPDPILSALVVAERDRAGDPVRGADLARRATAQYPRDVLLFNQELSLRSRVEDETAVLDELERRVGGFEPDRPEIAAMRLYLASRRVVRGEWEKARDLLGDDPEAVPENVRNHWFLLDTDTLAALGETDELATAAEAWKGYGEDALMVDARHALLRSYNQIEDREGTTFHMLQNAMERSEGRESEAFVPALYKRFINTLTVRGRHDEALALLEVAKEKFPDETFTANREDILRSATQSLLGAERLTAIEGTIHYAVEHPRPGDRLLVSPDSREPYDAPYPSLSVPASGRIELERPIGTWPQRWVLRDRQGHTVGSGSAWPRPDAPVDVALERRPPSASPEAPPALPGTASADGRRRVFQVILDCADWRLIEYGLARGELPFFEQALANGHRAVLDSNPPFTALAVSKLVFPNRRGLRSFPELLHQLGGEIEGLNFIGRNPLAGLEWVLPQDDQLFETFARAGLASVNLLHSHGALQVGRNAEVVGPGDQVRSLEQYRSSRPLTDEELELTGPPSDTADRYLSEMAADFDVVEKIVAEPGIDFMALRVASLDLFTHGRFQEMQRSGQDDGDLLLYRVYRYMDRRLAGLLPELDGDDVLIVMSDHGIRTPMEHDRHAVFIALGGGIGPGRIEGTPPIQHVSGWIADLFGVETGWPGAGTQEWIPSAGSPPRTDEPASPARGAE